MPHKILWEPDRKRVSQSNMYHFLQMIARKYHLKDHEYYTVHQWSIENPADFWEEVLLCCDIRFSEKYHQVVDDPKKMPGAKWFAGGRLNFAENMLRRKDDTPAIIFRGEDIVQRQLTFNELYEQVSKAAAGLKKLGVKRGDRVAAFMPNVPETVVLMLATASLGAIWSSSSPDFGIKGVLDRFSQIEPKVVLSADGYFYKGKAFDIQEKLKSIIDHLPTVEKVVMVDYTGHRHMSDLTNGITWEQLMDCSDQALDFVQLPFDHPLYILYSSGTTGLPKSIVHSAGGTLLQHLKELKLHSDIHPGDRVFYFTTCGWMMWNWVVSSLALGATLILYDGNPFYPSPDYLLKMADELNINFFGTSAKYIASLEKEGIRPSKVSAFNQLKVIASTGSQLMDESFEYVYRDWKKDVQLSSIAGGTDIISCFMLGNPTLPVRKGEIQCKGLGMDVDCFDDMGNSLIEEEGELVCKTAFPSMPVYFWNDANRKRYNNAYFNVYPGIWRHGDYIKLTENGGVVVSGRSDATLNPQGVRIGIAEIYRVVENMEAILDAVVVGKKIKGDELVVLFVKMKEGYAFNDDLIGRIKQKIRTQCSPRHVPSFVLQAPDIPYTINGKKVEIAVKKLINGQEVSNTDVLSNPECLDYFRGVMK